MKRAFACLVACLLAACGGAASPPIVAFYGDSITSGTHSSDYHVWTPAVWSPTPVQHIAALAGLERAINHSYDGASISDARIFDDGADTVVIRYGVADLVHRMSAPVFLANITRLVVEARAAGARPVLTGLPHAAAVDTREFDAILRERADTLGVLFVEIYSLPFGPADLADSLHPAEGYSRRIGEAIASAIRH